MYSAGASVMSGTQIDCKPMLIRVLPVLAGIDMMELEFIGLTADEAFSFIL